MPVQVELYRIHKTMKAFYKLKHLGLTVLGNTGREYILRTSSAIHRGIKNKNIHNLAGIIQYNIDNGFVDVAIYLKLLETFQDKDLHVLNDLNALYELLQSDDLDELRVNSKQFLLDRIRYIKNETK